MDNRIIEQVVDRFELTDFRPLTSGGQKLVATARREGEPVVVKLVAVDTASGDALERARRESELLARLDHPNVVRLLAPLEEFGGPPPEVVVWLEEHLDGKDLRELLGPGQVWDWREAMRLGHDLAAGLAAMHEARVVHRDLSPGNVRQCGDGSFRIMDPGYARHEGRTTMTGLYDPGTPGYVTPEHASPAVRPTASSDIFQVGILLYEALTGRLPVDPAGDMNAYLQELRNEQVASIRSARPDLPPEVASLVDRCLHRQSGRRFLDGAELRTALEEIL